MLTFATLFDAKYLAKGLALLDSMERHLKDWQAFVLALDNQTFHALDGYSKHVIVTALSAIMDQQLERVAKTRTHQEFCWTLESFWTAKVFEFVGDSVAYIDADCYLFGNLEPLYREIQGAPVAIVPHRWTTKHAERLKVNGTYNVGWVYFSPTGRECLMHWRNQCLAWCHAKNEQGKFADQGYLNDWPERWNAHVVQNIGIDLAPWNQEQYYYEWDQGHLYVIDGEPFIDNGHPNIERIDAIQLYHFHDYIDARRRSNYPLHPAVADHLYREYEQVLARVTNSL